MTAMRNQPSPRSTGDAGQRPASPATGRTAAVDPACSRPPVAAARRIVVKLGTRVLTEDGREVAFARVAALAATAAALEHAGREVVIVSSGAVGLGRAVLALEAPPRDGALRQACAAVGQARLTDVYARALAGCGLLPAQILVAQGDFDDRARALRLRDALEALLARRIVPVINENDAVAREALRDAAAPVLFDDNDRLAALVAAALGADLLVLLTDVDAVFAGDPKRSATAAPIARVDDASTLAGLGGPDSPAARGGMRAKVAAAELARRAGCHVVIASGRRPSSFSHAVAGEAIGTWFPARPRPEAHRRWIAFSTAARGVLVLDAGAVAALYDGGASLLTAGVQRIEGSWRAGDVVELQGPQGAPIGRARLRLDAGTLRARCRRRPRQRRASLVVRRNAIVLEPHPVDRPATAGPRPQETP